MPPVRLEPAAPGCRIEHSTTELLRSHIPEYISANHIGSLFLELNTFTRTFPMTNDDFPINAVCVNVDDVQNQKFI